MTLPSWSVRIKVRVAGVVTVSVISRKEDSGERLAHAPGDRLPASGRPLPSKAWALGLVLLPPSGQERNNWPFILGHLHALCHLSHRNQSTKPRHSHYISFLFFLNYYFWFSITVFTTLLELKILVTVITTWGGSRRGDSAWCQRTRRQRVSSSPPREPPNRNPQEPAGRSRGFRGRGPEAHADVPRPTSCS